MDIQVKELPNDVIEVSADVDGRRVTARGWKSATTNHYPKEHYKADGHRKREAKPRAMTAKEKRSYYESLIQSAL